MRRLLGMSRGDGVRPRRAIDAPRIRRNRWTALWRGLRAGLVILAVVLAARAMGLFNPLERAALDARFLGRFLLVDTDARSVPITVVTIDSASLSRVGRWPWDWTMQAILLERLLEVGPAAVAVNMIYSEPPESAAAVADLARVVSSGPVVLATQEDGTDLPPTLREAAAAVGHVRVVQDPDGVIRRVSVSEPVPPLALAIAQTAATHGVETATAFPDQALLARPGGVQHVLVNYRPRAADPFLDLDAFFPTVSAADLLAGRADTSALAGRIVLVGLTAPGLGSDMHLTPLRAMGRLPSLYVHASLVRSLYEQDYLQPVAFPRFALVAVLCTLPTAAMMFLLRPWPATGVAALFAIVLAAGSLYAFVRGVWLPFVPLVAGIAGAYVAALWHAYASAEREADTVRQTFRRYLAPQVVDRLLAQGDVGTFGERRATVTVLFADLRGFTEFAEGAAPERVVSALKEYLSCLSDPVLQSGGTLDKYLGDGLMAVFGAPLAMPEATDVALEAAVRMQRTVDRLGRKRRSHGLPTFSLGIGLHTGDAVLGSVGHDRRLEYTAIGDVVNVANRLQSMAAPGEILVTLATRRAAADKWSYAGGRALPIRGRREPVEAFTLQWEPQPREKTEGGIPRASGKVAQEG